MTTRALLTTVLVLLTLVIPLANVHAEDDAPDLETVDGVKKALADKDPSVRLAAARAALAMQDKKLVSPLVKLLKDEEVPIREAALDALVAREDKKDRASAAKGIAALLKSLDRDPDAEDLARENLLVPALHDLAQPSTIKKLLDIHTMAPQEQAKARLHAVANIPAAAAIEALIAYGSRGRRGGNQRGMAGAALQYATGVKLERNRNDPDNWREWWRENKQDFDFEVAFAARREKADAQAEKLRRQEEKRRKRAERGGSK